MLIQDHHVTSKQCAKLVTVGSAHSPTDAEAVLHVQQFAQGQRDPALISPPPHDQR